MLSAPSHLSVAPPPSSRPLPSLPPHRYLDELLLSAMSATSVNRIAKGDFRQVGGRGRCGGKCCGGGVGFRVLQWKVK